MGKDSANREIRVSSVAMRRDSNSLMAPDTITIDQEREKEVTVIIWQLKSTKFLIKDGQAGHGSLLLRKEKQENAYLLEATSHDNLQSKLYRYISYTKGVKKNSGRFLPSYIGSMEMMMAQTTQNRLRKGDFEPGYAQKVTGRESFHRWVPEESWMDDDDKREQAGWIKDGYSEKWGKSANRFISLPAFDLDQIGLDMNRMVDWCIQHQSSERFCYQYVSNRDNCVSIAWKALEAGGGEAFCKLGGHTAPSHYIYITAQDLKEYAAYIKIGIHNAQTYYRMIKREASSALCQNIKMTERAPIGFSLAVSGTAGRLYNYGEWKAETKGNMLGYRGKCADLDESLRQYSKYEWRTLDLTVSAEHFSKKLDSLLTILKTLSSLWQLNKNYVTVEKPALVALSLQVCQEIEKLKAESLKSWDNRNFYEDVDSEMIIPPEGNFIASQINKMI
jgi:hypothetical protein